jgi:hypothetical protein
VQVIGRDDDQQFHALIGGQRALGLKHLPPVAVATRSGQTQRGTGVLIVAGVATERAAHQFKTTLEPRSLTVGLTDEGTLSATDKAHSYFCQWNSHSNSSLFEAASDGCKGIHPQADVTGYIMAEI